MKKVQKIKVAKYKRVSTDEQKLKKNSIIAQDELLDAYIAQHPEMVLVGDFADEGVSGTKIKRTELQNLLEMVEANEVDLILVTKLDRWFRDIEFYYQVQGVLDRHNTAWRAILEEYDTLTADGRLKVNIMLSVAQNEAERTSERITVVFDSKVRHKQAITGALPPGFMTAPGNGARMVVKDPTKAPIVEAFLDRFELTQSVRGAMMYVNEEYNAMWSYNTARNLIKNPLLCGHYRDVDNFCEAYITRERFEHLQSLLKRNIRKRETNRVYMFSGLLICPCCGRRLSGTYVMQKRPNKTYSYNYYRCQGYRRERRCANKKAYMESRLERLVLSKMLPELEKTVLRADIEEKRVTIPKIDKRAVRDEIERLNRMYQKGRISEEDYDAQYEKLEAKLKDAPKKQPQKDYTALRQLLETDFKTLYDTFTAEERQQFWRGIVEKIELVDDGKDIAITFL